MAADRELLCAEVWHAGGRLVVGDQPWSWDDDPPIEEAVRREVATAGVRLRNEVDPRVEVRDETFGFDADIGAYEGGFETARFAHKLYEEFRLTLNQVAEMLNADGYLTKTLKQFSGGTVKHLLDTYRDDLRLRSADDLWTAGTAGLDGAILVTYGPDRETLRPSAERYNESLSRPYAHVVSFGSSDPDRHAANDDGQDQELIDLLTSIATGFVGTVYVSSERAFGSEVARELAYAHIWRHGGVIAVNGLPVDPHVAGGAVTEQLRRCARSGVILHACLRAHDGDALEHEETSLEGARRLAMRLRHPNAQGARPLTFEQIAGRLDEEAFPTRKRVGQWSGSAVRELLLSSCPPTPTQASE